MCVVTVQLDGMLSGCSDFATEWHLSGYRDHATGWTALLFL